MPRPCAGVEQGFVCVLDLRRERLANEKHLLERFILCATVCALVVYLFGPRDLFFSSSPGDSDAPAERGPGDATG